jgi:hypothetical protein
MSGELVVFPPSSVAGLDAIRRRRERAVAVMVQPDEREDEDPGKPWS